MSTAPMPILYVNSTAHMGGAEHSLLDLIGSLDRSQFSPYISCFGDGPLVGEAERRGIPIEPISIPRPFLRTSLRGERSSVSEMARGLISAMPLAVRLIGTARRLNAGIVHSNGNKACVLSLVLGLTRQRVVWHVRDFLRDGPAERMLARIASHTTRAIIANSAAVARRLSDLGCDPHKVYAIPNGIDMTRCSPNGPQAELRSEFGWPDGTKLVGVVAMLAAWKGQDVFLRAAKELTGRRRDVRFVIVGSEIYETKGHGGYTHRLRQMTTDLGLEDVVGFCGYRNDVPAVLRGLDVLVHSSIEPEPFGRVIAEAMACGTPVVWSRGGGADEIVGSIGLSAFSTPPGDERAMAQRIECALAIQSGDHAWLVEARHRIAESFSLSRHVNMVEALYRVVGRSV